jgi:hypothetical protein
MKSPDFWNDTANAQRVMKTASALRDEVEFLEIVETADS